MIVENNNEKIKFIPQFINSDINNTENIEINSHIKYLQYKPEFFSGEHARFIINSNGFLDPLTLNLMFSIYVNSGVDISYQFDNSIHSAIKCLVISCNGVELEKIDNYEYINSILFDATLDINTRRKLEHHGFGYNDDNDISIGCGEEFMNYSENNKGYQKKINYNKRFESINNGIQSYSSDSGDKRIKTFKIPLMSSIFGMNIKEYKYIPLHLFPYLQIDIYLNKYCMFNTVQKEIYIDNSKNKGKDDNDSVLQFHINYFKEQLSEVFRTYGLNDNFREISNFIEEINTAFEAIQWNNIVINKETVQRTVDLILAKRLLIQEKLESYESVLYTIIMNHYLRLSEYYLITNPDSLLGITRALNREITFGDNIYITTDQMFFESSDHYNMINKIRTFSLSCNGFDSIKVDFNNDTKKPHEYVTINYPRQSITRFISAFYSKLYLTNPKIRQLARYSKNIKTFNVRIGIDNYPNYILCGNTSNTSAENNNNILFIHEMNRSFENTGYDQLIDKGIINRFNYSINYQLNDELINTEQGCPRYLPKIKYDVVGRCLLCISTKKLTRTTGLFRGANNNTGSDIVRYILSENDGLTNPDNYYEFIMIEYDKIFIVKDIGQYKIIR